MEETMSVVTVKRGQETILVVDDEPAILTLVTAVLAGQGYTVLAARSPAEALAFAGAHAGVISMLLTDIAMPGMNGWDLAKRITLHDPRLKHLFMSGHPFDVVTPQDVVIDQEVHFIQKPFKINVLAARVREILDS
jgi:two-component system, cell cycle sensor histidine kinase and response regulator CckA